jgi:cytidylate kinase
MNETVDTINRMSVVTISREYGSGGGEIARRLAGHLGWQLIDHEIVERVALELGTSTQDAEAHDEHREGAIAQLLNTVQYLEPALMVNAPPEAFLTDENVYRDAVSKVVQAAANRKHAVIVGRGSQVLLKKQRDVLHVRIVAPLEKRIIYVMQREGLDSSAAQSRIQSKDNGRMRYLQATYHESPDDAHLYDLILNTSVLDLESAVEVITLALQLKAKGLYARTGDLGPAVGLSPYPQQPEDFRSSLR